MNWTDEKVKEFEAKYGGVAYPFVEGIARTQEEALADIRTALQEAHTKGYEEGRLAELEASAVSDIQIAKEKAEQLKAQGTQEALEDVKGWVMFNASDKCVDEGEILHYLDTIRPTA